MLAVLVVAVASVVSPRAQQPVFRSTVDRVRVDALVTHGGEPVTGLSASDFLVYDNGVPQPVELIESGGPVKVLLVFDISASVAGERLAHLRTASDALVAALGPDDLVGLLTFSQRLDQLVGMTREHGLVRESLAQVHAGGRTALIDAVYAGLSAGFGESGRWLVLVFSDGADTASWLDPARVITEARRSSLVVYGVTAGATASEQERPWLLAIADATGGRVTPTEGTTDLGRVFVSLLNEYRSRYVLAFAPTNVPAGGDWHALTVRVKGEKARHLQVTARKGYFVAR
jgi:VWFA-related protein